MQLGRCRRGRTDPRFWQSERFGQSVSALPLDVAQLVDDQVLVCAGVVAGLFGTDAGRIVLDAHAWVLLARLAAAVPGPLTVVAAETGPAWRHHGRGKPKQGGPGAKLPEH